MDLTDLTNQVNSLTPENKKDEDKIRFDFQVCNEMAAYPNIFNKENIKLMEKWGLTHMEMVKFRFNINFNLTSQSEFIVDLFNSATVRNACPGLNGVVLFTDASKVENVKFSKLSTSSVSLDILDPLYDSKIVNRETGYIKKDFEENYEGIQLCDKLKGALVNPDDENFCIFNEKVRNEFLFKIFQHIAVGGSLCQYEDYIGDYLNLTKCFYKDLVAATKDQNTNQIVIRSYAYQILELNNKKLFKNPYNPQNFMYISVDPYQKTVSVWYNKWEEFW